LSLWGIWLDRAYACPPWSAWHVDQPSTPLLSYAELRAHALHSTDLGEILATVRVAAAAVLLSVVVSGCGRSDERAAAISTPSASTAAAAFSDYQGLPSGRTYTTTAFRPSIRFTVPSGRWSSEVGDTATDFTVAVHDPPGGIAQALLAAHRVHLVYDPQRGGRIPGDRVPLHGSFADWLQGHRRLRVTAPKPVRLMGLTGVQMDVSGRSQPPRVPEECSKTGSDCVPLFYDGFDPVNYARSNRGRFIVLRLPSGGELVIEQFVEPAGDFARGLRLLRPLLGRLELAGESDR
jgi:hypothetical protein